MSWRMATSSASNGRMASALGMVGLLECRAGITGRVTQRQAHAYPVAMTSLIGVFDLFRIGPGRFGMACDPIGGLAVHVTEC